MLKLHFVTNSCPDITKKFKKIENWKDKRLKELFREPQKVYARWDDGGKKKRTDATSMGSQNISNENILREGREDNSPYDLWRRVGVSGALSCGWVLQEVLYKFKCRTQRKRNHLFSQLRSSSSSLTMAPTGLSLPSGWLLISRVKREECHVLLFECTQVKF
jgi:hypothetical protein